MKPVLLRCGGSTNRIYAIRRYTERANGLIVSSVKEDATEQAIMAVAEHRARCRDTECRCSWSYADWARAARVADLR